MKTKVYTYPSATGLCEIKAWQWYPDSEDRIKAVIMIHHGMAEHAGRYKESVEFFVSRGYAVFMNDMCNHGQSNTDPESLGYFGDQDGWLNIIKDAKTLFDIMKQEYPDKKRLICGHSMGSMVMRCFINQYGNDFDGAVFIGTSGTNPLAKISVHLTKTISKIKGTKYKSSFLYEVGFGAYDKPFEKRTRYDWGSRDQATIDDYVNDDKCGFLFSSAGYTDLAYLVMDCNADHWYANVHNALPVLLTSGEMDPVGNYGKGVREVYEKLIKTGHEDITLKLYPEARHEILNESNKDEVREDINHWIEEHVLKIK